MEISIVADTVVCEYLLLLRYCLLLTLKSKLS
jgi:hypothetical protein